VAPLWGGSRARRARSAALAQLGENLEAGVAVRRNEAGFALERAHGHHGLVADPAVRADRCERVFRRCLCRPRGFKLRGRHASFSLSDGRSVYAEPFISGAPRPPRSKGRADSVSAAGRNHSRAAAPCWLWGSRGKRLPRPMSAI